MVLVHVSRSSLSQYVDLQHRPLQQAMLDGSSLMLDGVMALISVFILFAIIDVPAQAFFFAKNQRMSKQDVKEEHKSSEGRPEVRQRIRQVQQQIPVQLYQAVSQVLNYILQLKAFRSGQRAAQPLLPTEMAVPSNLSEVVPS
jgi:flagellar biosynthesis protein FlhB